MRHGVNGTVLNVVEQGHDPPALVFLHYFGGSSRAWSGVMERLAPDHRCIALDLRGFGGSDALEGEDFTVADAAEDVSALIGALRVEHYVLIGHSMGGKIACAFAATQPPGLKALVLVAPSPPTPEPMEGTEREELLKSYGDRTAAAKGVKKITIRQLPASLFETCVEDNLASSRSGWSWWLERGSREDISSRMPGIQVPTLVVASAKDPAIAIDVLDREVMPRMPQARMTMVPETGHLSPIEAPDDVGSAIRSFVGQLP